jgi:hypothetical protein
MMLKRALHAEILKLKRTIALKMVALAPLAVVSLTVFMAASAPFSTLHHASTHDDWKALARVNLQFWGLLMMPLYITLQTALIAGLDHSENQWKAILARPIPRWTIYVAKLLVVGVLTAAASVLLLGGILLAGTVLRTLTPDVRFESPVPFASILLQTAQMTGLAFLSLTIQHWVSLRWRAFSVATGFGIVATITTFAMLLAAGQYGSWPEYYPWALPMLVLARQPHNAAAVLWISAIFGTIVSLAGCVDFCRRDVT